MKIAVTERDWQDQVVDLARMLGWDHAYHTFDSRRSAFGFPDLVLARDRILFLELKTETGNLSDAQRGWLTALLEAGGEAYVARPRDLDLVAYVLTSRCTPAPAIGDLAALTRGELGLPP